MKIKHCPKCKTDKPIKDFGFDRNRNDGCSGWCKDCKAKAMKSYRNVSCETPPCDTQSKILLTIKNRDLLRKIQAFTGKSIKTMVNECVSQYALKKLKKVLNDPN